MLIRISSKTSFTNLLLLTLLAIFSNQKRNYNSFWKRNFQKKSSILLQTIRKLRSIRLYNVGYTRSTKFSTIEGESKKQEGGERKNLPRKIYVVKWLCYIIWEVNYYSYKKKEQERERSKRRDTREKRLERIFASILALLFPESNRRSTLSVTQSAIENFFFHILFSHRLLENCWSEK